MAAQTQDPIKHVVVLMLENHSFDQMLGCMKQVYPHLEGVDPAKPNENRDYDGQVYTQTATTERQMLLDPHHEVDHVAVQLQDNNSGFVKDFSHSYPASTALARQFIMSHYPLDFLPALHSLAREFTICDHWFSSLPGPTWPNRFFALTGTSNGRVNMPGDGEHTVDAAGWFEQNQETIFDRLSEKAIHWKVYFHDIPQTSVLLHQRRPSNAARYYYINQFYTDARGAEEDFPQFTFIEPDFNGADENDDHPPHDIMKAEKLIADVYNAIRANDPLWQSTLLVIFYDEHGGFYDHVVPPVAQPPDGHDEEYNFKQLGIRVPAVLVSPWIDQRVEQTQFDHTSLLKYLIDKWALGPLGKRAADATSIGVALTLPIPRAHTTIRIELTAGQLTPPDADLEEKAEGLVTEHHKALQSIVDYMKIDVVEGLPKVYTWAARAIEMIKRFCQWLLGKMYHESAELSVSMTQPDRLSRETTTLRDDFAKFLMHQKLQAVPALALSIRDKSLPPELREYAVRTLAGITGRRFHHEPDKINHADEWLRRHGK
jgi:phospholipase C